MGGSEAGINLVRKGIYGRLSRRLQESSVGAIDSVDR